MPGVLNLPQLRVASPCPASWDQMDGEGAVRFCHQCKKHVYDLTVLTREEIADIVVRTEGRFCGRLYQRPDGRALAADCPVGARRAARRLLRTATRAAAVLCLAFGGYGYVQARSLVSDDSPGVMLRNPALSTFLRWVNGKAEVLGSVSVPVPRRTRMEDLL
jgi:hypothetical protein